MTRFTFGLLALIATSACSPSTQLLGGGNDNTDNSDALWRLGEDAEISVTRDGDWCENDQWSLWVRNITDNGRNNSDRWDDDPLEEGDDDTLEGVIGIYAGDLVYVNGGCDGDDDTWLVENSSSSTRITVNIEMIEIDGEEYEISDLRDDETAAPEYGECVKLPRAEDLVCRVLDEDDDGEYEYCADEDDDGFGDPDDCDDYESGDQPSGWVRNNDDCDDDDEDEHDECQSDDGEVEYCDDDDGDGFGDPDQCADYEEGDEPSGYVDNNDDCDDTDPDINPDEDEIDNGVDDDCDGDEDDDDNDCEDCNESDVDEVEVVIIKSSSWCTGDDWQTRIVHNNDYDDDEEWPLAVGSLDDDNTAEDEIELVNGERYRIQMWCDHDNDGSIADANSWGVMNTGDGVVEYFDRIEIDGRVYSISTAVDSTPSPGSCTRPAADDYHLICEIDF